MLVFFGGYKFVVMETLISDISIWMVPQHVGDISTESESPAGILPFQNQPV